jgi:drug/metabolite transporter (DMT)-like permease
VLFRSPLFSLVFGAMMGEERLTKAKLAAVVLGLAGLALLFWGRAGANGGEMLGLGAVALGTASYCYGAVLARPLTARMGTMTLAGWQTFLGGLGLALVSAALEGVGAEQLAALGRWPVWPALGFLVVGGSLIGFTVYVRLLGSWGPFRAGLYSFVSPAIAVAAGALFLGESMGLREMAGAALMFLAAALALVRRPANA